MSHSLKIPISTMIPMTKGPQVDIWLRRECNTYVLPKRRRNSIMIYYVLPERRRIKGECDAARFNITGTGTVPCTGTEEREKEREQL